MNDINPDIEALARVLATIESRRPEWGFSLDAALEYREEKWSRHIWEAQRLLEEMTPWLFEHDRQVAERAWDEGARWAPTSYVRRSVRRSARRPQIAVEFGRSLDKSRVGLVPSDNPYRKEQENNDA